MSIDVYKEWLGIPEEFRPPTHYQLLRLIDFDDDQDRIYKFYKKLNSHVRKYATGKYTLESQALLNEMAKAMLCLTDLERKRDYDVTLGREIPEEELPEPKTTLEFLLLQKVLEKGQLPDIENFASRRGLTIRDALVQMKLVDVETATRAYAMEHGHPYIDLAEMVPEDAVLDMVPRGTVRRHNCIPLMIDDDVVLVACAEEADHELEDEMRLRFDMPMRTVMATPRGINQAISTFYPPGTRETVVEKAKPKTGVFGVKKAAKESTTKSKADKPKASSKSSSSSRDPAEQRKIDIIVLCWLTVAGYFIDNYVLKTYLTRNWSSLYFLSLVLPGAFFAMSYESILGKNNKK